MSLITTPPYSYAALVLRSFADLFRRMQVPGAGPPLHLIALLGGDAREATGNLVENIQVGRLRAYLFEETPHAS